jgi:hypothetical protein
VAVIRPPFAAPKEVIDACVWGGIHFRTPDVQGAVLGSKVAHYLEKQYFSRGLTLKKRRGGRFARRLSRRPGWCRRHGWGARLRAEIVA